MNRPCAPHTSAAHLTRAAAVGACLALAISSTGCAVASATAGAAISVTGAVVSTGIGLTGKAIGAGIDAASSPSGSDRSGIVVRERISDAPADATNHSAAATACRPATGDAPPPPGQPACR
ncbi:hypothetical protein FVQ98_13450 [Ottowia sp. GY511]|uniref:Lipoprotein n=1 Tax=Ottowia flava TaxID=2675430 RepID=A0ABW4KT94_9BURK|nr:hypothetical protein [Ottowia sp. GY511]TXK26631.1 hypothetical protein FVQ98_13450 [Ottowia sp. GY511]